MHKAPIVEERLKRTPKVGDIVKYKPDFHDVYKQEGMTGIVTKLYHDDFDALVLLSDGRLFIDRTEFFTVLQYHMRQKIDIGDLVEYDKYQALVLDRKTINPNYNTERVYHPDEYHCKVLLLNSDSDNDQRWVRTKWLKLLSKSS